MLTPRKTKFRRYHRRRNVNKDILATRNNKLHFGDMGLMILDPCELTSRQIEAARRVMARHTKRGGKIWIKVFPHKTMGSGKGSPDFFVADLRAGTVVFEIAGSDQALIRRALELAAYKLPSRCKVVTKEI